MKEKERGKNETEKKRKKGVKKKKFQSGNRTRDLLICRRPSLPHSYRCCSDMCFPLDLGFPHTYP